MMPLAGAGDRPPGRSDGEILSTIGETLGACVTVDSLYRTLYHETSKVLDTTCFLLGLYDEPVQTVNVVFQVDSGVELPGGTFPLGNGFTSQVIKTRRPRLIRRWSQDGPPVQLQYATDRKGLPESGITLPLLFGARVLGVLSVQSYEAGVYDATDLLRLQVIAGHVAVGLDRLQRSIVESSQLPKKVSKLETILASMSEALLIVDARGCIVRLNDAARKLLCPDNGSGGIVLGQPLDREQWGQWPLGPRGVAQALGPLIAALRQGETLRDLEIEVFGEGKQVLSFSCAPLREADGSPGGGVIVFRDVTGRREVERIKDEVLSIASHELKSPITLIKGKAQMLQRQLALGRATPESLEEGLAAVVKGADHLVELLDLLMDLSRIESGRLELRRGPADLVELASKVIDRIGSVTTTHEIALDAPECVEGLWDAQRLEQLLHNLVSNAVKYSPNGGTVLVSIHGNEKQAVICIRDEGVGIDKHDLPRLFDRFYRAEGVRRLEGSGLGLFICQGIVSAHNGDIRVESLGRGKGSTFTVTLPRWPSSRGAGDAPARSEAASRGGRE